MTAEELIATVAHAKANGREDFVVKLARKCKGDRAKVMPGVYGQLVQWGDGTWQFPSVVFVKVADVERALAKLNIFIEIEAEPES